MLFFGPRQTCGAVVSNCHDAAQSTSYAARRRGRHSRTPAAACPPASSVYQYTVAAPQTPLTLTNRNVVVVFGAQQQLYQSQEAGQAQQHQPFIESMLLGNHAAEADRTVAAPAGESIAQHLQAQEGLHAAGWPAETLHSSTMNTTAVQVDQATLEQQSSHSSAESKRSATARPSHVRRCRNVNALLGMLHKHHKSVSPHFWVTALCHLYELLAEGCQQVPGHNWSQLQRSLLYLADPEAAAQQRRQRRWEEIQQRIQQRVSDGTWVGRHQQQQQQDKGVQDAAPLQQHAQAPLQQFTAQELATLVWALAKINPHLTPQQQQQLTTPQRQVFWPAVLQQLTAVGGQLTPRDAAVVLWALTRLHVPMPAGWLNHLVESQSAVIHSYTPQAVAMLLHCCARQSLRLHPYHTSLIVSKVQQDLRRMQPRDLSIIVWSLAAMRVQPVATFMSAAMQASKLRLSTASWAEVAALLAGTARLGFCPSGHWLLELYDQLYWTADQAELRQLTSVIWSLGRLRVAVPQELLERLVAFARLQLRPLLQSQEQQQGLSLQDGSTERGSQKSSSYMGTQLQEPQQGLPPGLQDKSEIAGLGPDSNNSSSSAALHLQQQQPGLQDKSATERLDLDSSSSAALQLQQQQPGLQDGSAVEGPSPDSSARRQPQEQRYQSSSSSAARQRYMTAKLLYMLLQGFGWLKVSLGPKLQQEVADSWLPAVLSSSGSLTHVQVPAALQACAELEIRLSPAVQAAVLVKLQQLQPDMNLRGFALGLRAAARLGCRVMPQWVQQYLGASCRWLPLAQATEIIMLLRCCVNLKLRPPAVWLQAMYSRVLELLMAPQLYNVQQLSDFKPLNPQAYGGVSGGQLAAIMEHLVELGVNDVPHELLSAAREWMGDLEQQGVAQSAVERFRQAGEVPMPPGVLTSEIWTPKNI